MLIRLWCSEVYIRASSKGRPFTIREVKASNIGQLVKISGIVTRCSDVKPLMQVAVYTCEDCGFEIYQVIVHQFYTFIKQYRIGMSSWESLSCLYYRIFPFCQYHSVLIEILQQLHPAQTFIKLYFSFHSFSVLQRIVDFRCYLCLSFVPLVDSFVLFLCHTGSNCSSFHASVWVSIQTLLYK